ncbi:MAG: transcription elongation factor GreA, partial [Clostridium sp.]
MGNETREILLTQDGFNKLEQELEYLRGAKRIEVAGRIKIAIEFGDISENSEYDEAKNEQAQLEMRILDLENTLRLAKVVDEGEISTRKVGIGIVVKLYDYEFEEEVSYTIV